MSDANDAKLSRGALVALVVGSMVGAGIFTLPAAFGRTTGVFGALLAWAIAGVGMLMLALVFQTLSRRRPDLDAGIYAYAKAGFGNYLGFVSAFGYWVACCFACLACRCQHVLHPIGFGAAQQHERQGYVLRHAEVGQHRKA